jgi:hypothetical protein
MSEFKESLNSLDKLKAKIKEIDNKKNGKEKEHSIFKMLLYLFNDLEFKRVGNGLIKETSVGELLIKRSSYTKDNKIFKLETQFKNVERVRRCGIPCVMGHKEGAWNIMFHVEDLSNSQMCEKIKQMLEIVISGNK